MLSRTAPDTLPAGSGARALALPFDAGFVARLERLVVLAKRLRQGSRVGDRKAPRLGSGLEFADHRAYAPGDDLRRLDWNLYGRLGRPMVRLCEQEQESSLLVLVDTSASMAVGQPRKGNLALQIAAALVYVGLDHRDTVALHGFAESLGNPLLGPAGRARFAALLGKLAALPFGGRTDLAATVEGLAAAAPRPGICVLVSDLVEVGPVPLAVDRLLRHRLEVALVRITSPQDRDGSGLGQGPTRLLDAETGLEVEVDLTPALARRYADRFSQNEAALANHARKRRVPFLTVDAGAPFDQVVRRLLRAEGLRL